VLPGAVDLPDVPEGSPPVAAGRFVASEWTVETLKEYTDAAIGHAAEAAAVAIAAAEKLSNQRFEDQQIAVTAALAAQKEAVAAALTAADRAVAKAETAAERRFEGVNEFRGQLADQALSFMSRAEALLQISANAEKIDALSARVDRSEGRGAGVGVVVAWVMAGAVALGVVITLLFKIP
jgi:hypothetical protein